MEDYLNISNQNSWIKIFSKAKEICIEINESNEEIDFLELMFYIRKMHQILELKKLPFEEDISI